MHSTPNSIPNTIIHLSKYRRLFKDDEAYNTLVSALELDGDSTDFHLVLADERILFAAMTTKTLKDFLCSRIVKRFAESPELVDELRDRMENDEIVD